MSQARKAALLVSVYNRPDHLRRCVDSLAANPESRETDLFVASDGPAREADEEGVQRVRDYVATIQGFRSVIPLERESNLGSHRSIVGAITSVIEESGRVIFLEDDNIVSRNFLEFMNEGLKAYAEERSIFSVCGYAYPVALPRSYRHTVYKWQGFSAWGVGLWADRWREVGWGYEGFATRTAGWRGRRGLAACGEHLIGQIRHDLEHSRVSADAEISYHLFVRGLYSVFPTVSKVRNTGHDGTGEHCGRTALYLAQELDPGLPFACHRPIEPDERVCRALRRHFRTPMRAKLKRSIGRLIPERQRLWLKGFLARGGTLGAGRTRV